VLASQVQVVQGKVRACQAAYERANADVRHSSGRIAQLQAQVQALREEDAQLCARVPLPVNRLCHVRQWLADKVAALDAEQAALQGRQLVLLTAESRLRAQETEASLLDEAATTLNSAGAAAGAQAMRAAAAAHDSEVAAARRQRALLTTRQQQAAQHLAAQQRAADARDRCMLRATPGCCMPLTRRWHLLTRHPCCLHACAHTC
jgi:chromosome segregation ATPase